MAKRRRRNPKTKKLHVEVRIKQLAYFNIDVPTHLDEDEAYEYIEDHIRENEPSEVYDQNTEIIDILGKEDFPGGG